MQDIKQKAILGGLLLLFLSLSGCTWMAQQVDKVEDKLAVLNKEKKCSVETEVSEASYHSKKSYRCVGAACQQHGCGEH